MRNSKIVMLSALAFVTFGASLNFAGQDSRLLAGGKGSIKGHVLTSSGTPAVGCPIDIFTPMNSSGSGSGGSRKSSAGFDGTPSPTELQGKTNLLTSVTTDDKGNFEVKDVEAATYKFIAGSRSTGMVGGKVTVKAGEAASVEIKLNPPPNR